MMSFSFLGLWQFLLERWRRLLSILLIALALGLAYGAYGNLAKTDNATAREEICIKIPSNLNGTAAPVYFNNLYTSFISPAVAEDIKAQLHAGEHLTATNTNPVPSLADKNEVIVSVIPLSSTSMCTFTVVSASEARSKELLDILLQQGINQGKKIVPDLQYTVISQSSSTIRADKSITSVVNTGVMLASLAFIVFAALLGLYYLFSDYIATSDTLSFYFDKRMLGDVFPNRRELGKGKKENRQFLENTRAVENMKLFTANQHSILLFGGNAAIDIEPAVHFLEEAMKDTVHIVRLSGADRPDAILSGIPSEKTALIIAPSILASELTSQFTSRVDSIVIIVKRNKTRLKDIQRSLKWLHASGTEVGGFLFLN